MLNLSSLLDSLAAQLGWTEWSIQVDSWSAGHGEIFWVIGESFLTFFYVVRTLITSHHAAAYRQHWTDSLEGPNMLEISSKYVAS